MRRASPIVYAHRGASAELPENTLEAFQRAVDLGADAIETDAHMTSDGHVVLSHDPTGARMAGVEKRIADASLAEVRTWNVAANFRPSSDGVNGADGAPRVARIPTFEETLAAFPGVFFNVDAKQVRPSMMRALLRVIAAAGAEDRVRIASFSPVNLLRARRLGYRGPLGLSGVEVAALVLAPRVVAARLPFAGDAAQVPEHAHGLTFARRDVIERLHGLGLRVDFWTIDDPARARELFAMGADGVVTNDPRRVRAALVRSS